MPQIIGGIKPVFKQYPFQRLTVYNSVTGTTFIHWDLHSSMVDRGPYIYQLQVARTPNEKDEEWENRGDAQEDAPFLTDDLTPSYGYALDKYYRVVLTTGEGRYISMAYGCFGQLRPREWKLAKDIRRRERLRAKYTAVPVTVLQKKKYGEKCPYCTSAQSDGSSNANCEYCFGTGYLGGYQTPYKMQVMDISPSRLKEIHYSNSVATFNTAEDRYQARAAGVPELYAGDIIIDLSTDQRFRVTSSPVIAQIHRVPLVRQVDMYLLPYSDIAYRAPKQKILTEGCGPVVVDQDFNGVDTETELILKDEDGRPVENASVTIKDNEGTPLYKTTTDENGEWRKKYKLEPGEYTVSFQGPTSLDTTDKPVVVTEEQAMEDPEYVAEKKKEAIDYLHLFD